MATRTCLLAVLSFILGLQSTVGEATGGDDLSPRTFSGTAPRTIDEVLMQANGGKNRMASDLIFDGLDMVLTKEQHDHLYGPQDRSQSFHSTLVQTWPHGQIPYEIQYGYFTTEHLAKIQEGMTTWEDLTCVTFRPATSYDVNKVQIISASGCYSQLGKWHQHRPQTLSLNTNGCFYRSTVEHELGHAIGLVHEHQRPMRDDHLGVYMSNVMPAFRDQLQAYRPGTVDKMGLPYDYYSVMHYGKNTFSIDHVSPTMFAYDREKQTYLPKITEDLGKVLGPSFIDVKLVNMMYNCSASCRPMPACRAPCFVDRHCKCVCEEDLPPVPCKNNMANCESWAHRGECYANRPYMEYFCRKACGLCPTHGKIAPKEPQVARPCEDRRSDCPTLKRIGDCENNHYSMMIDCWKTCSGCSAKTTPARPHVSHAHATTTTTTTTHSPGHDSCTDVRPDCIVLASRGHCTSSLAQMTSLCKKTCNLCTGTSPCEDEDLNCRAWAEANYCTYYPHIVPTCSKSCGACT